MAELEEIINEPSESQKRIKELSEKVRISDEEKETERIAREAAESKTAEVERERDFYASFTNIVGQHPFAKDHKDEILNKVKSGYTVEDATYAVLAKAGKLEGQVENTSSPAGGSAATTASPSGAKSLTDMTQEERRSALIDAEKRGDIYLS